MTEPTTALATTPTADDAAWPQARAGRLSAKQIYDRLLGKFRYFAPSAATNLAYMLYRAGSAYCQDGLLTVHNSDFRKDPRFRNAYARGKATGSWGRQNVEWRAYVCCWAAWSVRDKYGDFVECGVNRGGLARTIIDYVDFAQLDKRFWLLDTFEGLPEHLISKEERRLGILPGGYAPCYDAVVETFRTVPGIRIVKGIVPDTLPRVTARKICYLSLDMNNAAPEIAAAEHFWDRLVSGGIIVLDDYGWAKQINQKLAFDRFADSRGVRVLSLPTGQGLIIKR
jgi:O-methyltransferase